MVSYPHRINEPRIGVLLNAIATPLPAVCMNGATIQKATFQSRLRNSLQTGAATKKSGQTVRHPWRSTFVPYLLCKAGKKSKSQMACAMPMAQINADI